MKYLFIKACFYFSFQIYMLICIFMTVISLQNSKAEKYGLGLTWICYLVVIRHSRFQSLFKMYAFFELFSLDFFLGAMLFFFLKIIRVEDTKFISANFHHFCFFILHHSWIKKTLLWSIILSFLTHGWLLTEIYVKQGKIMKPYYYFMCQKRF